MIACMFLSLTRLRNSGQKSSQFRVGLSHFGHHCGSGLRSLLTPVLGGVSVSRRYSISLHLHCPSGPSWCTLSSMIACTYPRFQNSGQGSSQLPVGLSQFGHRSGSGLGSLLVPWVEPVMTGVSVSRRNWISLCSIFRLCRWSVAVCTLCL